MEWSWDARDERAKKSRSEWHPNTRIHVQRTLARTCELYANIWCWRSLVHHISGLFSLHISHHLCSLCVRSRARIWYVCTTHRETSTQKVSLLLKCNVYIKLFATVSRCDATMSDITIERRHAFVRKSAVSGIWRKWRKWMLVNFRLISHFGVLECSLSLSHLLSLSLCVCVCIVHRTLS